MTLENKQLGIWGKDKIVGEDKKVHAKDYYCINCYSNGNLNQASGFWPCIDPDIQAFPLCENCITKKNLELLSIETINYSEKK